MKARTCQVAQYMTSPLAAVAPACGREATTWSDDVPYTHTTVWMCREHADEIARDGAEVHEAEDLL